MAVELRKLLVLDIDDTIMSYPDIGPKWWEDKKSEDIAIWRDIVFRSSPVRLPLADKIDTRDGVTDVLLLTARNGDSDLINITMKHLKEISVRDDKINVLFCGNKEKGIILKEYLLLYPDNYYSLIRFYDDSRHNIDSVLKHVPNALCYHVNK